MNINEEQNRAKLIKLRKRHLIVKQQFYKSFGIQYRLHLHFYLLWKERIACALKAWRSWINVRDASFRIVFHAIEREISLSNNATHPIRTNSNVLKAKATWPKSDGEHLSTVIHNFHRRLEKQWLTFVCWIRRTKHESNRLTATQHIKLMNQLFYTIIV